MRLGLVASLLCLCTVSLCLADPAKAAIRKDLNVPAEELSPALQQVATTYELQVLYPTQVAKDLKTHGAIGTFTSDEALTKVLSGTGLSYKYLDANTVTVFSQPVNPAPSGVAPHDGGDPSKEGKKDSSGAFLLAQVDQGQAAGPSAVEQQDEEAAAAKKRKEKELQEVTVTGSRIPTPSGAQEMPVYSYTREDIDKSGETTLADFFNGLPDVSVSSSENGYGYLLNYGGKTTVQLHGLPLGTTLLLINGRRVEAGPSGSPGGGYFDLNNIPLSAVERVEVLPVGASAIYGANALGGAVNIILRKNVDGVEVNGKFGHADAVNESEGNLSLGRSWTQGSISFLGTYQERGDLLASERYLTSTTDYPSGAPTQLYVNDACAPGNVYSLNGQNLPGLSSPVAGIPTGISGTPTTQQFIPTAGKLNLCNSLRDFSLTPQTQRVGLLASANYELGSSLNLFSEVMFSEEHLVYGYLRQIQSSQGSFGGTTLGASNPYNPFGEPVGVSFTYPGYRSSNLESGGFVRPLVGIEGSIFKEWHLEATAFVSRDRFEADFNYPNSGPLQAALSSSDPNTALNPFNTAVPGSPQVLESIASAATDFQVSYVNQLVGANALLRGPLLTLPAGPLEVALGGEYGQDKEISDSSSTSLALFSQTSLERRSYAVYAEARAPIFATLQDGQIRDRLALTAAGRFDDSNDFGGKATWQVGFLMRPIEAVQFTGGYGVSYQAPTLDQILGAQFSGFESNIGSDPFRGGQAVSATVISGANPGLKPETGNSRTLGVALLNPNDSGFAAGLNWFAIAISKYIGQPDNQTLINNPSIYPGAVIRAPPTTADQQQGFLGQIIQVNALNYNFGDLQVSGVDANLSYGLKTSIGQVKTSLAVANVYRWQSALAPSLPSASYVSQAGGNPGWAPRWKASAAVDWEVGRVNLNLTGRYTGKYRDTQIEVPNTNELGNIWICDFNLRWKIGQSIARENPHISNLYLALGVINLFDRMPPFSYGLLPYDYTQYDLRGRFIYAQMGAKF
jgi:iron complex outermembrane receptor protein